MEVIELSSEDHTATPKKEVIVLSDEDHITSPTQPEPGFSFSRPTSAAKRISPPPSSPAIERRRSSNVLDLANWLSSSDDDSIIVDLSRKASLPKKTERRSQETAETTRSAEFVLPKPRNEDFLQSLDDSIAESSPKKASEPRTEVNTKPQPRAQSLFVDDMSDPIDSSPHTSQKPSQVPQQEADEIADDSDSPPPARKFTSKEWREANKSTHKKEDILAEMIIETAVCLSSVLDEDYFKQVFELPTRRETYSDIPLISWKRKAKAIFNQDQDVFVPCDPTEVCERVLVLLYDAPTLLEKIDNRSINLDLEMATGRARLQEPLLNYHPIIMVLGLKEHLRKLQTIEDRMYREKMLTQMNEPPRSQKRKRQEELKMTASEAQKAIYVAEVELGTPFFPVRNTHEAIDWLHTFTYTIGTSWYDKSLRYPKFANMGNIKSGADRKGTFMEIVKKFNLMTQPRAEKLYEFYSTPVALYKRFKMHDSLGTVGGKNIVPPSTNIAMRNLFRSDDPNQVIYD